MRAAIRASSRRDAAAGHAAMRPYSFFSFPPPLVLVMMCGPVSRMYKVRGFVFFPQTLFLKTNVSIGSCRSILSIRDGSKDLVSKDGNELVYRTLFVVFFVVCCFRGRPLALKLRLIADRVVERGGRNELLFVNNVF